MAGLNLIQSYLSSSEESADENVPERNKTNSVSKPGKNTFGFRLPVPDSILSLRGATHHEDVTDDPALHDGRIRSFKHERGNWATLVYVEYLANDALHSWLREVEGDFGAEEGLKSFDEFHLSLTKSLVIKFHWIESFVEGVKALCQITSKIFVELSDLKVYCNEDRTRTFLGIRCEDGSKRLQEFVYGIDKLLAEYQLPPFYEEASFHVSVMWCLGDAENELSDRLDFLNESLGRIFAEDMSQRCFEINNIQCKIGNKMYTFNLK